MQVKNTRLINIVAYLFVLCIGVWIMPSKAQPNTERIVFMSDRDGPRDIYTMNSDGSDVQHIIASSEQDLDPQWSPNRQQIAFVSTRDGRNNIYLADASGGSIRRLTLADGISHDEPFWSPDGQYIAYVSDEFGNPDIFVIHVASGDVIRLTDSQDDERSPSWSPDGQQIAYLRATDFVSKIWLMDNNGANARRLIDDIAAVNDDFVAPAWSPDGSKLAFGVNIYDENNGSSSTEIYLFDMESRDSRIVTTLIEEYIESMTWSPDGVELLYVSEKYDIGEWVFTVVNTQDGGIRVLTGNTYSSQYPSWHTPYTTERVVLGPSSLGGSGTQQPDSNIRCPGALPTRLVVGEVARVTYGPNGNRLRSGPGTNYQQIDRVPPGGEFEVLDGPECNQSYAWWQVNYNGQVGWTAEADNSEYWLERVRGQVAASNLRILTGGYGLTNGARMGAGEFQVEYYCENQGYDIRNDDNNWYCTRGNTRVFTLQQADFNQICRETYNNSSAIAYRYGDGIIPAYRWRCYEET